MGVAFALFLTPIIAAILLLSVIFIVVGCILLIVGGMAKMLLHKSKLNIIANILLIFGFSLLWLGLFGAYPVPVAIICFIIGFFVIVKYEELNLLKFYIPAIAVMLVVGCPFFLETMPYLQLFLLFTCGIACLVVFAWLVCKRKIVREAYSFILLSEGTLATMWFLCQCYLNYIQ